MNSLSLSAINNCIYELGKCKSYVTLPLSLLPSNYLKKYILKEGESLKTGSRDRLLYVSQMNFGLKKSRTKALPE